MLRDMQVPERVEAAPEIQQEVMETSIWRSKRFGQRVGPNQMPVDRDENAEHRTQNRIRQAQQKRQPQRTAPRWF